MKLSLANESRCGGIDQFQFEWISASNYILQLFVALLDYQSAFHEQLRICEQVFLVTIVGTIASA